MDALSSQTHLTTRLNRLYVVYFGGLAAFIVVLGLLEQAGMAGALIAYAVLGYILLIYALIGVLSRTMQVSDYYVAGRTVPPAFNGMANAADALSSIAFIGLAGLFYTQGYGAAALVLGWIGGYVLMLILVAPQLRKLGGYTLADFFAVRFGGMPARLVAAAIIIATAFAYAIAQITATGLIASRFLGLSFEVTVFLGLGGILVCSWLGGMRAVTYTQVAQYLVLLIAFLLPVTLMALDRTGLPFPQLGYGGALEETRHLDAFVHDGLAIVDAASVDPFNFAALIVCLMLGTAALPHVATRCYTAVSVRGARQSMAWSVLFIAIVLITAPAYAAFARAELFAGIAGLPVAMLEEAAGWLLRWGAVHGEGLVMICGSSAANLDDVIAACGADHVLTFNDLQLHPDLIVLASPEMLGLPFVISALVAAGAIAAALSTADGLLLSIANTLSHDVYHKAIDRTAPAGRRLIIARLMLFAAAVAAALLARAQLASVFDLVMAAFSLAAAGLFPVLVLGIWWKRATTAGALCAMAGGFGITLFYLWATKIGFGDTLMAPWAIPYLTPSLDPVAAGVLGIPAGFVLGVVVSLLTPAPGQAVTRVVDALRRPRGEALMIDGALRQSVINRQHRRGGSAVIEAAK